MIKPVILAQKYHVAFWKEIVPSMTSNLSVLKQHPFLVNPLCGCEKTWTGASSKLGWLLDFLLDLHFFFCILLIPHPIWWKITQYACTCTTCSCPVGGQFDMEMIVNVRWYDMVFFTWCCLLWGFLLECVVLENIHPYPCHRRSLEIPRWGGGGFKGSNFRGQGGVHGKLVFQRVTNNVQNIESNVWSIWSKKTYLGSGMLFCNKSQ